MISVPFLRAFFCVPSPPVTTSVNGNRSGGNEIRESLDLLFDLDGQFACRHNDQGIYTFSFSAMSLLRMGST